MVMTIASLQAQQPGLLEHTFRGTRIINGHSVEVLSPGNLDFLISHRFGPVNSGAYGFFGLDQATMRLGFDYGLTRRITMGIGRSTLGKHYDTYAKIQLLSQQPNGLPITATWLSSAAINTLRPVDGAPPIPIQSRLAYTHQLLVATKQGRFSLQVMPTVVHYNLVPDFTTSNDLFAVGGAAHWQATKNLAFLAEYYYVLPQYTRPDYNNSLAIGIDINTGSHVFQIQLTNAAGMIEKSFIGETSGTWGNGDIRIGFNMARTFILKGRRF